ncbi:MAG: hypothetical protein HKM92_14745 [Arenibacter sp.]|nr:hypothetical protein [Arenibacter sp.]
MQKFVLIIIAMVVNEVTAHQEQAVNLKAAQVHETVVLVSSYYPFPFGKWSEEERQSTTLTYCHPKQTRWPRHLFINFRAD